MEHATDFAVFLFSFVQLLSRPDSYSFNCLLGLRMSELIPRCFMVCLISKARWLGCETDNSTDIRLLS